MNTQVMHMHFTLHHVTHEYLEQSIGSYHVIIHADKNFSVHF